MSRQIASVKDFLKKFSKNFHHQGTKTPRIYGGEQEQPNRQGRQERKDFLLSPDQLLDCSPVLREAAGWPQMPTTFLSTARLLNCSTVLPDLSGGHG